MNSPTAPVVEPEPTLRDVLFAVNGLGTRMDSMESEIGSMKTEIGFMKTEIGSIKTEIGSMKTDIGFMKTEIGSIKTEMVALTEFSQVQYTQLSTEIGRIRADVGELRAEVGEIRTDVAPIAQMRIELFGLKGNQELLFNMVRPLVPQVEETVRVGRTNRDLLREVQEDLARIDAKIDQHIQDPHVHLPRQLERDDIQAGPMAAA